MKDIGWFFDRIGQEILRGNTTIKVTEGNYKKLFDIQSETYTFTEIEQPNTPNVCISCEG